MRRQSRARPRSGRRAGSVRVSGGLWKGRWIEVGAVARPTSARAREALFDLLGPRLLGARFLDLYAGSGAVGLEALSRGASRVVLVERDSSALARNVARLGPPEGSVEVLPLETSEAIRRLKRLPERFEIAFADPPYEATGAAEFLGRVATLLSPRGTFVLQCDEDVEAARTVGGLALRDRRAYGRNVLLFYEESNPSF